MAGIYRESLDVTRRPGPASARKSHLIVYADLAFCNIVQLALQQFPLQRLQVIDEQFAFDMIVFVEDDTGGNSVIGLLVGLKVLVNGGQGYLLAAGDILQDLWHPQTAFVV